MLERKITDQNIKKIYADGAYHSPANDDICKNIDMIFTGIQGAKSRYDLEMTSEGLMFTDTYTGEQMKAVLALILFGLITSQNYLTL